MNTEVKEEKAIYDFEKLYAEQYQRCSVLGWNLAIFLNQNSIDLSSLPEPIAESLKGMILCRKIVENAAHEHQPQVVEAPLSTLEEELAEQ